MENIAVACKLEEVYGSFSRKLNDMVNDKYARSSAIKRMIVSEEQNLRDLLAMIEEVKEEIA